VALKRIALAAFTIMAYNIILTQLTSQGSLDLADWMGLAIGLVMLAKAAELGAALSMRERGAINRPHTHRPPADHRTRA
jgi:hypothetical protein